MACGGLVAASEAALQNLFPNIKGLKDAINKKQSESEFLTDLKQIHQVYAQSVYQSHSANNSIPQNSEKSTENSEIFASDVIPELSEIGEVQTKERADVQHYLNANVNTEIINFCGICIYRSARI